MHLLSGLTAVLIAIWLIPIPSARATPPEKIGYLPEEFRLLWENPSSDKILPYRLLRTTRQIGDGQTEQRIQFKQQDKDWTLFVLSYDGNNPVHFISLQNYGMFEKKHRNDINRLLEQIKSQNTPMARQ